VSSEVHDVVVVGGGPTGLLLACELRLQGLQPVVLERDSSPTTVVRSLGLHARSVEILDQRGMLSPFLEQGTQYPMRGSFAGIMTPVPTGLDTAHPYLLGIPQTVTDRLVAEHAAGLGVEVRRGVEVVDVSQHDDAVTVALSYGPALRACFVVGCDGGRSTVRRRLGVAFPGEAATAEWLMGEMEVTTPADELTARVAEVRERHRWFGVGPMSGAYRVVVPAAGVAEDRTVPPTLEEVRARLRAVAGTDFGVHSPRWLSRFSNATRLAETYRVGRVFLAGDAAHVHPPIGGQGLNLGLQDAFNLGWKIAAQANGWAPADLLDTYDAERRPVAADVFDTIRAQIELTEPGPGPEAARRLLAQLLTLDDANRYLVEKIAGIGIRYDVGGDIPIVGRRLRDVALSDGRLFDRMHAGRGLLLDRNGSVPVDGWHDRIDHVVDGSDELDHDAYLLRPDGYVVWSGDDAAGSDAALTRWFGVPS
jgi:rifampicin monooxygenase